MQWWTPIPWIISGLSLILATAIFMRNKDRDTRKDTKIDEAERAETREQLVKVNLKLDQICATTNDIKTDIKAMNKELQEHSKSIAILQRDLETAFIRIDELREKINQ